MSRVFTFGSTTYCFGGKSVGCHDEWRTNFFDEHMDTYTGQSKIYKNFVCSGSSSFSLVEHFGANLTFF